VRPKYTVELAPTQSAIVGQPKVARTREKSRPPASKLKRIYAPRIISDHIMVQEDFEQLHKFLLETEGLDPVPSPGGRMPHACGYAHRAASLITLSLV